MTTNILTEEEINFIKKMILRIIDVNLNHAALKAKHLEDAKELTVASLKLIQQKLSDLSGLAILQLLPNLYEMSHTLNITK